MVRLPLVLLSGLLADDALCISHYRYLLRWVLETACAWSAILSAHLRSPCPTLRFKLLWVCRSYCFDIRIFFFFKSIFFCLLWLKRIYSISSKKLMESTFYFLCSSVCCLRLLLYSYFLAVCNVCLCKV